MLTILCFSQQVIAVRFTSLQPTHLLAPFSTNPRSHQKAQDLRGDPWLASATVRDGARRCVAQIEDLGRTSSFDRFIRLPSQRFCGNPEIFYICGSMIYVTIWDSIRLCDSVNDLGNKDSSLPNGQGILHMLICR